MLNNFFGRMRFRRSKAIRRGMRHPHHRARSELGSHPRASLVRSLNYINEPKITAANTQQIIFQQGQYRENKPIRETCGSTAAASLSREGRLIENAKTNPSRRSDRQLRHSLPDCSERSVTKRTQTISGIKELSSTDLRNDAKLCRRSAGPVRNNPRRKENPRNAPIRFRAIPSAFPLTCALVCQNMTYHLVLPNRLLTPIAD